ncbi:MAG: UDP-N-acetylmuramate--L-alanine ligase [Firmicutes bacterium]|nr:UDP-N-acetylmuramate--L-alanine ligase [Bacillota bacterium]
MNLKNYTYIHFIGIGGISMSSLAEILIHEGYKVSGSDMTRSDITDHLASLGIDVYIGQKGENIADGVDLAVYTAAVKKDNPEYIEAERRGIKIIERAELVGLIMKNYDNPISIAGTHGKTTASSMMTEVLIAGGKDPAVSIGGILPSINGNFRIGARDFFVVETCEYCDSFLKFFPSSAIILNVDRDHTDYFKTMEQMYDSFRKFANLLPEKGILVINDDIKDKEKITDGVKCKVVTYSDKDSSDWYVKNVDFVSGCGEFDVVNKGEVKGHIKLNVPGMHNVLNATAVFAVADYYGVDRESIEKGLYNFTGTNRRFQKKGEFNGVTVIDDYAHHPTEIKATLSSAARYDKNKLWCVFQPHTYSRTKSLLKEFSQAFDDADNIVVLDIYAAREKDTGEIHSKDLVELLVDRGKKAVYKESFDKAVEFLAEKCQKGDMLITIGAGDVYKVGEKLVDNF